MKSSFLIILIAFLSTSALAQKRDVAPLNESTKIYSPDSTHSPHNAAKRSLMAPGWGQVYNRSYWKVPIIYGVLGSLASAIVSNQQQYSQFTALAIIKRSGSIPTPSSRYYSLYKRYEKAYKQYSYLSQDNLADASNLFERNRDLSILGFAGFWGINVLEAYIEAKFMHSYTMDNNLSFKVSPALINQGNYVANNRLIPSLKLTMSIN